MFKSIEEFVGNTPLVQLKRMPGNTSNIVLAKLEGNNPAGSVKDRPALFMIQQAEARGEIKPGDTLIEATSGNTGIALAMAAAMRGYKMVLVMPEHMSVERRQVMRAFGAEIVLTPKEGSMEAARDAANQMRDEGRGIILDQFSNPDNPQAHYEGTGPEIWRDTQGKITHFVSSMGTTGTIMGCSRYLKEQNPEHPDHRRAAQRRRADSRHPQVAAGLSAENLRFQAGGPADRSRPAGSRGNHAPVGCGGRHFRRHFVRRRIGGRAQSVGGN